MLKIESSSFNQFTKTILRNTVTGEYIAFIPEYGANIAELVLNKKEKAYSIIDGYSTPAELVAHQRAKSDKLIPFPNRIKDGKYSFRGKNYQLPINFPTENHAIHGLIYDKSFREIDSNITETQASIELEYVYNGDISGYPFQYAVQVTYFLTKENGFKCTTTVKNRGDQSMPFGDGWHPYFQFGKKVDELMLKIPATKLTEVDDRMIPTGRILSFDQYRELTQIGDTKFDSGFRVEPDEGIITTEIYEPDQNLKIKIWQETGKWKYNFLQIYIPPSRMSIAVEPMTCNIDAFNNKDGLIVLEPGRVFEANYGVMLE